MTSWSCLKGSLEAEPKILVDFGMLCLLSSRLEGWLAGLSVLTREGSFCKLQQVMPFLSWLPQPCFYKMVVHSPLRLIFKIANKCGVRDRQSIPVGSYLNPGTPELS